MERPACLLRSFPLLSLVRLLPRPSFTHFPHSSSPFPISPPSPCTWAGEPVTCALARDALFFPPLSLLGRPTKNQSGKSYSSATAKVSSPSNPALTGGGSREGQRQRRLLFGTQFPTCVLQRRETPVAVLLRRPRAPGYRGKATRGDKYLSSHPGTPVRSLDERPELLERVTATRSAVRCRRNLMGVLRADQRSGAMRKNRHRRAGPRGFSSVHPGIPSALLSPSWTRRNGLSCASSPPDLREEAFA